MFFFVNSVKIDDDAEIVDFENNYENETFYFPSFRTQSFIRSLPHVSCLGKDLNRQPKDVDESYRLVPQ